MKTAAIAAAVGVALAVNSVAPAGAGSDHRGCAAKFDRAQRVDMESFRDFDAEAFRSVHDPDAISIFPTGQMFVGIDAIMKGLNRHFTKRGRGLVVDRVQPPGGRLQVGGHRVRGQLRHP